MDEWPFWLMEENIRIVNELNDEEEKRQKKDDGMQKMPNFNPSSVMNSVSGMANKFK